MESLLYLKQINCSDTTKEVRHYVHYYIQLTCKKKQRKILSEIDLSKKFSYYLYVVTSQLMDLFGLNGLILSKNTYS